jgi:serine/threonine protein kinase
MRARRLIEGPVFEAQRIPSPFFPSCIQGWLRDALPKLLPFCIQDWLRHAFPVWFLPARLIVKELNPKKPAAFYRERMIYSRLKHLQGSIIPKHYGIAQIEHPGETLTHKAHLLELVDGTPLSECTKEESDQLCTKQKIDQSFALLSKEEVVHGDPQPCHFIHTKQGTLRIIDFGDAYVTSEADKLSKGDAKNALNLFSLYCVQVSKVKAGRSIP